MRDLKHLTYFEDLLQEANNALVVQAQAEGKKCVAFVCENTPEPLMNLDNTFGVRLHAPNTGSMDIATYYMTSFLCETSRALLERAIEGGFNFADCVIAPDGCTMINRCVENMELLKTMDAGKDRFFYEYMEIPLKADDNGVDLLVLQCKNHILRPLHDAFGTDVSDAAIRKAVAEHNRVCALIRALGDFRNWNVFEGLSTDSYALTVGSGGEFTGAAAYMGYPHFFTENAIHKVYGEYPSLYSLRSLTCPGVQKDCGDSVAAAGGILYYKSRRGIYAYDGSLPTFVGDALGTDVYDCAVGGSERNTMSRCAARTGDTHCLSTIHVSGYGTERITPPSVSSPRSRESCTIPSGTTKRSYARSAAAVSPTASRYAGTPSAVQSAAAWASTNICLASSCASLRIKARV